MRENCAQQFDAHWQCLERKNQVRPPSPCSRPLFVPSSVMNYELRRCIRVFSLFSWLWFHAAQEYYLCRQPERKLNACMFEKLVSFLRSLYLFHWRMDLSPSTTRYLHDFFSPRVLRKRFQDHHLARLQYTKYKTPYTKRCRSKESGGVTLVSWNLTNALVLLETTRTWRGLIIST